VSDGPRLAPLPADEWDDVVRHAVSPLLPASHATPDFAGNVVGTLVRHPDLTHAYLTFNAHLLRESTLSARLREVAVLRAALASRSDYLWDHHVPLALRAGLTDADIEGVRTGSPADAVDAVVVEAVDELAATSTLSDAMWARVREHLDERQVLDLIFTIGCYQILAVAVNALGIQPEVA
jgi:4-carboxymuconolactone decarboxylase